MFKIAWLRTHEITDAVHAELVRDMHTSRLGVRWAIVVSVPPTIYACVHTTSFVTQAICISVWLTCLFRIYVAETYVRHCSVRQDRAAQNRWEWRYAIGGISYSAALGAFAGNAILSEDAWLAAWAIAIVVGYSYSLIPFVALRPWIAWPQATFSNLVCIAALLWTGGTVQLWMAVCLIFGTLSMLGHIRRHYTSSLDALLNRRRIEWMATTDHLTGLWNRRYLDTAVAAAIAALPAEISFLLVDLDRFKAVNDTHGHEAGDLVIQEAGRRIQEACGPHAVVARIGGDEFAALVPEGSVAAGRTAWRISSAMRAPIRIEGGYASIGASIGVAVIEEGDTVASVNKRADEAMYDMKAASKRAA